MKNKLIIYAVIGVIFFLSTSLFLKQCEIDRLQKEYSRIDFEEFQDKVIIANQKIRDLKILNRNQDENLKLYEKEFDTLKINNISIGKKLKTKKAELKVEGQTVQELLIKNIELVKLHEKNEIGLKLTIANLKNQVKTLKKQKQYEIAMKIHYRDLYLDCSGKYQELYNLKFKPDKKYKLIAIGEAVAFLAYLFLKK